MGPVVDISIIHAGYDENGVFHPVIHADAEPVIPNRKKLVLVVAISVLIWAGFIGFVLTVLKEVKRW